MVKKIYINESQLQLIKESIENEEVTFYKFFSEAKEFIKGLLSDPFKKDISAFFREHGISRSTLINKMLDRCILTKKETINEPTDADGKKVARHCLEYKVPKKNFEQKMRRLYTYFFEND